MPHSVIWGEVLAPGIFDWAEDQQLIAVVEIGDVTYLWLTRPDPGSRSKNEIAKKYRFKGCLPIMRRCESRGVRERHRWILRAQSILQSGAACHAG